MAKKMARLDESPDFRPFKFRIQAFTNAFIEELARQGLGEDKIALKKVKSYLWHQQPLISRFNEDGKKSKSKGNHIWNIDAKKLPQGGWTFREFKRRIAGTPNPVAYIGLKWSWTPRIWDPQISRHSIRVFWSSPSLPSWLSWHNDELSGVPDMDATDTEVTVEARFIQNGQQRKLSHTFHLTVSPINMGDASFSRSRRPSLVESHMNLRRGASDSVIPQALTVRPTARLPPPRPQSSGNNQVMHVVTKAANLVAQAAQEQAVEVQLTGGDPAQLLAQASLVKQQQVLTLTAHALNTEARLHAQGTPIDPTVTTISSVIAKTATDVVEQAAKQVIEGRNVQALKQQLACASPTAIIPAVVSLDDVSRATTSYVAAAVDIVGPQSSEVEVLMTANALVQNQSRLMSETLIDPSRPHSTTV
jgi:organic radical activating enzyme